jgi:hypothetical protein
MRVNAGLIDIDHYRNPTGRRDYLAVFYSQESRTAGDHRHPAGEAEQVFRERR